MYINCLNSFLVDSRAEVKVKAGAIKSKVVKLASLKLSLSYAIAILRAKSLFGLLEEVRLYIRSFFDK